MSAPTPATQARLDAHRAKEAAERDLHAARTLLYAEALWIAGETAANRRVTEPELDKFRDRRAAYSTALSAYVDAMNAFHDAVTLPEGDRGGSPVINVGDPAPRRHPMGVSICGEQNPTDATTCTLAFGHGGTRHVASGTQRVVSVWGVTA